MTLQYDVTRLHGFAESEIQNVLQNDDAIGNDVVRCDRMAGDVAALLSDSPLFKGGCSERPPRPPSADLNESPPFGAHASKLRGGAVAEWEFYVERVATIWEHQALVG